MSFQVQVGRSENQLCADFPEAVARIEKINTEGGNVRVEMGYYADVEARNIIKANANSANPPMMSPSQTNFVKYTNHLILMSEINELEFDKDDMTVEDVLKTGCYKKLKELPEFANSVDLI